MMLNVFTETSFGKFINYPIKKYPQFDYIKRRYSDELDKVKNYYRERIRAVDNTHPFSKIINNLSPSLELDNLEYFKLVSADAIYLSKQYGFVSNINQGKPFVNVFYKDNSTEFLLYVENEIDPYELGMDWKNAASARVISSENTDIDFNILDGNKKLLYPQYTVIEVDLVMMMMQYKFWALERMSTDDSINPNVFVATVVLPNMLDNMLDITIFNRFLLISENSEITKFDITHPFSVLNLSQQLDFVLKNIARDLKGEGIYLEQLLLSMPVVSNVSMVDTLQIHLPFYSSRSEWLLWISRIRYIYKLLIFLGDKGMARNKEVVNYLPIQIRRLKNRATLITLPAELVEEYKVTLDNISVLVGKR